MNNFLEPKWQYAILFGLVFILLRIPKLGKFFRVINTLFHEDGHALAALLSGGSLHRIDLFADTSGACVTSSKTWLSRFVTVIFGYPASAAASFGMFYLLIQNKTDLLLYIISGILLFNLIFWVRNKYGILWLIFMLIVCGAAVYFENIQFNFYFLFLLAAFNITEAIWSTLYLVYISLESPSQAGDAYSLRQMAFLPAFFWALLFLIFNLWVGMLCIKMLWHFDIGNYLKSFV